MIYVVTFQIHNPELYTVNRMFSRNDSDSSKMKIGV